MGGRTAVELAPYVPRLALDWAEVAPRERWRRIDGSLVFVDISGFTSLSERLARRGRQGAEELTSTLSASFADLLAVAYPAGGSLLKFGGDALLLLFDGPDHASRAVASALRMRATMSRVGRVATSVGAIRLRMSVGVHSGELHFFRVGDSHREFIVTGPGASTTVEMEAAAAAGEIVVSAATAALIDARFVGAAKGSGFCLRDRRVPVESDTFPPAPTPTLDIARAIPVALRAELGGTVEPEHRQATIAFVHFDEIDALIGSAGEDAAADALDELTRDVQAAAEEQGVTFLGSDVDHDGGKIILVAGAPRALGDDEGRMLRALRRVADRKRVLPTRFGVNRGHVFVGEVGPAYRRTYTVMGDTVNLAARLMAKAAPSQILASGAVLEHANTEFEAARLPPFMVKGKAKPVEAFAIGEQAGRRADGSADQLPFVGRDRELADLIHALDQCREGRGGFVDLAGDAGIGKSRLVEELKKHADGLSVVGAFCETYESKTPYFAMRYLLRGALGIRAEDADPAGSLHRAVAGSAPHLLPWLPLLGAVVDIEVASTKTTDRLEPQFRPERTRWAVVELLGAVAQAPHLFVVENAQWLDAPSAEVLAAVASAANRRPWLLCLVHRRDPGCYEPEEASTVARVSLGPLDAAASRSMVTAATSDAPLRPHERDALVGRAGGNPLFLGELLRSYASAPGGAALPDSLEAVVATQIDRLAADDRRLLRYAAVLGPMFETTRLGDLVAGETSRSAAATVRRLRTFLEPAGPGWVRFRNQCYREVAYETLGFARRRELHARAGEAIEASLGDAAADRAEILSFHFLHAQQYDRCWRYALIGAERARAKYANVEAAELYERALLAASHVDGVAPVDGVAGDATANRDVAGTWEALGDVCLTAGIFDRAKTAFVRARRLRAGDPAALARLCKKESLIAMHQGQSSGIVRWINRGLRLLEGAERPAEVATRAQLRLVFGEHYHRLGRNREALPWCHLAIEDATTSGDRAVLARAYTVLDLTALALGNLEDMTHLPTALSIFEDLDNLAEQAVVLTVLGAAAYSQGRWDEALAAFDRSRDASLRTGDFITAAYGTCNIAEILIDQGRFEEAEPGLYEVLELWRSVRHPAAAGARLNLGRCALQRGDYADALRLFEEAKESSSSVSGSASVEADAWLAECLIHNGEADTALTLVDAALSRENATGATTFVAKLHRLRGYTYGSLGRPADAFIEFERSLAVARARGSLYDIALTLEAIATVRRSIGAPPDRASDAERRRLLEQLGVRTTFVPQLGTITPSMSPTGT